MVYSRHLSPKGCGCYRYHECQSARQTADPHRMRKAVFGKGVQENDGCRDRAEGGCLQQYVPEHFPRQGRRAYRARGVHVQPPVQHGQTRCRLEPPAGFHLRCGDLHPAHAHRAQRESARDLYAGIHAKRGLGIHFSPDGEGAARHFRRLSSGNDRAGFLYYGAWFGRDHARIHGAPLL